MEEEKYQIRLENVFEGPMDLLIHLIKKNEVDIHDIPIALITDQYLAFIGLMQALNIDMAGDFLLMAATLTHIKSRMLLPAHEGEEDEEDPRLEIARPLAEYLRMKSAAEQLGQRSLLGEATFTRKPLKEEFEGEPADDYIKIGLFELIDSFKKILDNVSADHRVDLSADRITVKDRIREIIDILEERGSITFDGLFEGNSTRSDVIVTFLAALEMVKIGLVRIVQHVQTGIIRLFYL